MLESMKLSPIITSQNSSNSLLNAPNSKRTYQTLAPAPKEKRKETAAVDSLAIPLFQKGARETKAERRRFGRYDFCICADFLRSKKRFAYSASKGFFEVRRAVASPRISFRYACRDVSVGVPVSSSSRRHLLVPQRRGAGN